MVIFGSENFIPEYQNYHCLVFTKLALPKASKSYIATCNSKHILKSPLIRDICNTLLWLGQFYWLNTVKFCRPPSSKTWRGGSISWWLRRTRTPRPDTPWRKTRWRQRQSWNGAPRTCRISEKGPDSDTGSMFNLWLWFIYCNWWKIEQD